MIMAGVVGTNLFAQVGFIVRDVETTKRKWAAFLGHGQRMNYNHVAGL